MNKNAVAMAADSAVTVGNHSAVYNSVDKLFQLSNVAPVGLLFYGRAELMGAPLEIIVSEYKKYLGNKTFSSLNQYVDDFCEYIEQNSQYFMFEKYEKEYIYYFCNGFLREIKRRFSDYIEQCQNSEKPSYDLVINGLNKIFMDYLNDFDKYEKLETSFAEYARDKYSDFLKSEIIDNENIDFLNTNQKKILCEKVFTLLDTKFSFGDTGIAIAGYGEKEIYPHLCNFSLDAVLNGKIRLISKNECEISDSPSAIISPFAQRDIIDNILTGIIQNITF